MKTRPLLFSLYGIMLAVFCLGCSGDEITVSDEQEILFEVNYVNYAWGFQNNGFLIDKKGLVRTFDKPKDWKFADSGPLSAAEMDERLSKTTLVNYTVPAGELAQSIDKLKRVSDARFSEPSSRGADMGASAYYIYRYDPGQKIYTAVLLQSVGDNDVFNLDPDAKALSEWLVKVAQEIR